jgi:hypothetical protein
MSERRAKKSQIAEKGKEAPDFERDYQVTLSTKTTLTFSTVIGNVSPNNAENSDTAAQIRWYRDRYLPEILKP